jgi:site-specific DNA recombinase
MRQIKKSGSKPELRRINGADLHQTSLFNEEPAEPIDDTSVTTGTAGHVNLRVAAYARVSSELQEKEETIESQLAVITAYADDHGIELRQENIFIDDGYTGEVLRRPGLDRLLDRVTEGAFDQALIFDPDRLARKYGYQILLVEEFQRAGCQPIFIRRPIGEGPDENLLLQIQGVIAEYEHAKIRERTRRGRLHRMRQGELVTGQRRFGYQYVKRSGDVPAHFEVIEEEADVVKRIYHCYVYESLSLRKIAAQLQDEGIPTVRGGRWYSQQISAILSDSIFTGRGYAHKYEAVEPPKRIAETTYRRHLKTSKKRRPREEWLPFSAPTIIDEETYELAQERLEQNKQLSSRRTKGHYLLRGMLRCGSCGMHICADTFSKSYMCPLTRRAYARDRGREPCTNRERIPINQLDELVWREVVKLVKKPSLLKKFYPKLNGRVIPRAGGSAETLKTKIDELHQRIKRVNNLFIRGVMDEATHKEKYDELKAKLKMLEKQREKLSQEQLQTEEIKDLLRSFSSFADTIKKSLANADFATRRLIVEKMVKCVVISEKVITIEHATPLKKNSLRKDLVCPPTAHHR